MQKLGGNAKFIKISGNGKNALDFHIAYYIGELATQDPKGCFHIVSKDVGFDPLIKHLTARNIQVLRKKDLAEIPELQISSAANSEQKIAAIIKNISGRGAARPRKVKTLANTINSLFTEKLDEKGLLSIVEQLQHQKYIAVNGNDVSYISVKREK